MSAMVSLTSSLSPGLAVAVVPAHGHVGELLAHQLVAPLPEGALGELLDVALVHQRHRVALAVERVLDGGPDEALGAHGRDRLDADARRLADGPAHLLAQVGGELLGLRRARLHLVAGVDVLGVLPEDHHVDQLGVHHRRRHAAEPAHRAQADVEVEDLAQRHVERADAATDRRGQRALDADQVRRGRCRPSRRAASCPSRRTPSGRPAPPSRRPCGRAWRRRHRGPAWRRARCRPRCRRPR